MSEVFSTIFWIIVILIVIGAVAARGSQPAPPRRGKRKRYVMRGYGGGKNATSLHPRQAAQGKRIVFIPGVGFRHVRGGGKRKR